MSQKSWEEVIGDYGTGSRIYRGDQLLLQIGSEIDIYVSGAPFGNDLKELESKLLRYVERFESAADWRANEYF